MKAILTIVLLAASALAQDKEAVLRATRACGPLDYNIAVKIEKPDIHPLAQPEPGKALIYVIQDDQSGATNFWGGSATVITRLGLDGAWVGANRGRSYFFLNVDPGDRHLCADGPPDLDNNRRGLVSATRFTAEPGRIYYLRVRLTGDGCSASQHPGWCKPIGLELQLVDEDKGQLLLASSRFSTSHAEK